MSTLSQKGFTIVELLIVVLVFAILVMLAAPNLTGMVNKNKVIATTNELVGLIEYARNTAKSTGEAVVVTKCADSESCGIKVTLLGNKNPGDPSLRVMSKQDTKNIIYSGSATAFAFYPDGTRGLHINKNNIKTFNKNGSAGASIVFDSSVQSIGDFVFKVKNSDQNTGTYCRKITVTSLGNVKLATEGCSS